jgi:hypothetical protein
MSILDALARYCSASVNRERKSSALSLDTVDAYPFPRACQAQLIPYAPRKSSGSGDSGRAAIHSPNHAGESSSGGRFSSERVFT